MYKTPTFVLCLSAGWLMLDKALNLTHYLQYEAGSSVLLKGLRYLEIFYCVMDRRNILSVSENFKVYATFRKFVK
jgi:hypothetical protein